MTRKFTNRGGGGREIIHFLWCTLRRPGRDRGKVDYSIRKKRKRVRINGRGGRPFLVNDTEEVGNHSVKEAENQA